MTGRCPSPGKTAYTTKTPALNAARAVRKRAGVSMRAYRCACGRWHLTTKLG